MPRFSRFAAPVLVASLLVPSTSLADDFEAGSLIIPMDTDYQDEGTLRAFGLVYELLRSDIPIRWVIKEGKAYGDVDFTVSATDLAGGPDITDHGYRGGPWVIDSRDADRARPKWRWRRRHQRHLRRVHSSGREVAREELGIGEFGGTPTTHRGKFYGPRKPI